MIKKVSIIISFIFIFNFSCYAEGQDGMATLYTSAHFIWAFLCISIYAIIGGFVLKLIFYKSKLLVKNQTLKAFSISFLIAVLTTMIIGDPFLYFIWHCF
jgi:hypothetical protein